MAKRPAEIAWRPDEGSFLSSINESQVSGLILDELSRHLAGARNGTIISHEELWNNHMEQIPRGDGTVEIRKKSTSSAIITDFDSLCLLDERLRELLGNWIPYRFSYISLYTKYSGPKRFLINQENEKSVASSVLIDALRTRRNEVDTMLKKLHSIQVTGLHEKEGDSQTPGLKHRLGALVLSEIEATSCEERWFYELCDKAAIFMEALGLTITMDAIETLADNYFESWVSPTEDQVQRFVDELAALGIKKLFDSKYGMADSPS